MNNSLRVSQMHPDNAWPQIVNRAAARHTHAGLSAAQRIRTIVEIPEAQQRRVQHDR